MLRLGTDFSGIDAPREALRQLRVPVRYEFASELLPHLRVHLATHARPRHLSADVTTRDHARLPRVDLYVAGFPCQDFSVKGQKRGRTAARGRLVDHPLAYIRAKRPRVVVLENVKGLVAPRNLPALRHVVGHLQESGYRVHLKVINSRDAGMVQNRERLWFVAIRNDIPGATRFTWPRDRRPWQTLEGIRAGGGALLGGLETRNSPFMTQTLRTIRRKARARGHDTRRLAIYDIMASRDFAHVRAEGTSPCLTTRNSPTLVWTKDGTKEQFLRTGDLLELQGFPRHLPHAMSRSQLARALGNSMSVPVLKDIFRQLLPYLRRR